MANLTEEQKKAYRETKKNAEEAVGNLTKNLKDTAKNEGVGSMIFKIIAGAAYLLLGGK